MHWLADPIKILGVDVDHWDAWGKVLVVVLAVITLAGLIWRRVVRPMRRKLDALLELAKDLPRVSVAVLGADGQPGLPQQVAEIRQEQTRVAARVADLERGRPGPARPAQAHR